MNKETAKKYFKRYGGREGLSKRALQIAQEIIDEGSYKRAIAGAGQLRVLSEISEKADGYWGEMEWRGREKELHYAQFANCIAPIIGVDGHFTSAHWEAEKKEGIN